MSGPPVTVVDSGGMPVRAVASGAPPLSVVDDGGVPVTVSEYGAPFILLGFPEPAWTVDPSITPASGTVGTVFTGSDGTITNGTVTARAWLLNGVVIPGATGSTVTPTSSGSLVFRVTATGIGGTVTKDSAAVAVTPALTAPVNTALPVITGTALVGEVLSSTTGTWTGNPTPTYARQWKRAGVAISGATAATYTLVAADAGQAITVTVTATNSEGNTSSTSAATAIVQQAPANTAAPVASGIATVGETLTTTNGTWIGTPAPTFAHLWERSADGVTGWTSISGETSASYVLAEADDAQYIRATVLASNVVGNADASSNVIGPVAEA